MPKKFVVETPYNISAKSPQNNTSYALNANKKHIAIIIVNHHGKNNTLPNIKTFKIILKCDIKTHYNISLPFLNILELRNSS